MATDKTRKKSRLPGRMAMLMLFAVGFIFLAIGSWMLLDSYRFSKVSVAVTGTVVSVDANSSGDGVTYRPVINYVDQRGLKRQGSTALSSSGYDFPVGTRLDIRYDPGDPSIIRLDSWFALWGFSLIFAVAGLVPLTISKLVLRRMRAAGSTLVADGKPSELDDQQHYRASATNSSPVMRSNGDGGYTPTVRRNR